MLFRSIGPHTLDSPLILAPMAGITSAPFRRIAREHGASMCISEMLVASTVCDRTAQAQHLARFDPHEGPIRAAQLYGIDPRRVYDATKILIEEHGANVIDMNFGCPVRKVTARGGGSALTVRWRLVGRLVAAASRAARGYGVPITTKLRIGLSSDIHTFRETSIACQDAGAAALSLHSRTADQGYAPPTDWSKIRELTEVLSIPVIGNGDVFEGPDAVRMMTETGCQGVMIGRGCLGRPWLFTEARASLAGKEVPPSPSLGGCVSALTDHVERLAEWEGDEQRAVRQMRKFVPLYTLGFASPTFLRKRLFVVEGLDAWHAAVAVDDWDPDEEVNGTSRRAPRLKGGECGSRASVSLPPNWMDSWGSDEVPGGVDDSACEG